MRAHLLLILLGVAVWARSIHTNHVNYDTPWLVVDNSMLSPGAFSVVPAILTDLSIGTRLTLGAEFLPVRDLSVLLDFALFGSNLWGHHATSLIWYLLACSLLLRIYQHLLVDTRLAWLAAALYTVHPLHVESVSWLASRKDVVSLVLFFAAVLAWMRGGWRWLSVSVLAMALSYWAKNTAITLPAILVMLSLLHTRQSPRKLSWWVQWVPYGLVALFGLWLTMHIGGMVSMMSAERAGSAWGIFTIEVQVILRYLGMMVWPAGLSIRYPEPGVAGFAEPAFMVGLLAIAALLALAARWKKNPIAALGILWFFITLLPVSQIIPIQNLMADRYLLLPSAGLILAAVSLVPPKALRHPGGMALAGVVVAMLSAATVVRSGVWHSSQALWQDLTDKHPAEVLGWTSRIGLAVEAEDFEAAQALLEEGRIHLPESAKLAQSQGLIAMARGDVVGAEGAFRDALRLSDGLRKSKYNLMLSIKRQGRLAEAASIGEELVAEHPLYETGWNGLGAIYIDQGNPRAALQALTHAHELNPTDIQTLTNLGNTAYLIEDWDAARVWWGEVLRLESENDYARRGLEALPTR